MPKPYRESLVSVREFLAAGGQLVLPWSQRAYAWSRDDVMNLLEDVREAERRTERPHYSLGRIYLAAPPEADASTLELVDGHQRTASLVMIVAVLRDLAAAAEDQAAFQSLIVMPADAPHGLMAGQPKLRLQPHAADFFERMVLEPGATATEPRDPDALSETERRILTNRDAIRTALADLEEPERRAFAGFLLDNCWLFAVTVTDIRDAWEMMSREAGRGLPHHASDLLKTAIVEMMPRDERALAGEIWDGEQARLGAEPMLHLVRHISTLATRRRPVAELATEVAELFRLDEDGLGFMRNVLVPRAALLKRLIDGEVDAGPASAEVNRALTTLGWLEQPLWQAPALYWLEERGAVDSGTSRFFAGLDRLAWVMRIAGKDPVFQERRHLALITELWGGATVDGLQALAIEERLRTEMVANLRSRTFQQKHYCGLVLRRLEFELGGGSDPVDGRQVTVEHVLPRGTPPPGSRWLADFGGLDGVRDHMDRLGNLTFLTAEHNQLAANRDFEHKQPVLAASRFALSRHAVTGRAEWTPRVILARTDELIDVLLRAWDLHAAS